MLEASYSHEGGRVTAVNFPFRYTPAMLQLKEEVDSGSYLGTVRRLNLTFRFPEWPRAWKKVCSWRVSASP